jgi:Cu+-exporting ATPase
MNATIPLSRLVEERAGQGIVCEIKTEPKKLLKIGRPDFVTSRLPPQWDDAVSSNNQLVAVSIDEQPYFLFELSDALRDDALQAIEHLRGMKFEVYIASGDKESVVAELTRSLPKITAGFGLMTPQSKRDFVLFLQTKGKIIAFVGDGINDAPALATADVGIAMGSGTDVAAQTAGLVLQKSGLRTLTAAIDLSRKITRIIKENFFWAFFYNVAAIPLAMMGLVTPMWAALAMALSSVSVVLNALRLRY